MSLQVCYCGWSKVTTYHGLRTHQGKMGCTPKGMRIPENQQYSSLPKETYHEPSIQIEDPFFCKPYYKADTLERDLTIHQDTLKGSKIKDSLSKYQIQPPHQNYRPITAVKEENVLMSPKLLPQINNPAVETLVKIEQNASQMLHRRKLNKTPQFPDFTKSFLTPTVTTQMNPPSPELTVKERIFETPLSFQCTARKSDKSRRALDFSTREEQAKQETMKADLQQKIYVRQNRMVEVRSSARACQDHMDAEWMQINSVFSNVMKRVQDARQKALQPLEDRRREMEREAESVIQNLQREIATLEQAIGKLNNSEFQVSSQTSLETSIDTSLSFGTLRAATSTMMSEIQQELEKLTLVELKRIPTFAVDVKLDPTTAHQSLLLSPDGREVRGGNNSGVPNTAERFNMFGSVLGLNGLISGRAYWEVEVANKSGWDLGVTRRSANRKGKLVLNPDNGYWVAVHYEGQKYAAMTAPPVRICPKEKPKKVGVFVDYEEGLVSFYDVTAGSHIYSFTECSFADEIRPYFSPHSQNVKNESPLVIWAGVKK